MWPLSNLLKNNPQKSLQAIDGGGWWRLIREPFTGGWQQNKEINLSSVRDFFAIYSCVTLITGDISKMAATVKSRDSSGVLRPAGGAMQVLLNKPNNYQNGVQFRQWWAHSKLTTGNAYALKQRGQRGEIQALYILDPTKVVPLVADDGGVYYQLSADKLAGIGQPQIVVPASEIIHDRYQPQEHPLVGVPPVYAAALAGALGKSIQEDSHTFFVNGASLSGILTAPGAISKDTAEALSAQWRDKYSGNNAGRVAVVGDGLKFEPMRAKGIDSQIVEQLRLSAEIVASCFHVPPYKIGIGKAPENPQASNLAYYSDCIQVLIEEMEACLDAGLELRDGQTVEFDTDDLMRMDTATIYDTLAKGVGGSLSTPNEARAKLGLKPLAGGDAIYMQQQNYSLEALAKRDAQADPFGNAATATPAAAPAPEQGKSLDAGLLRALLLEGA